MEILGQCGLARGSMPFEVTGRAELTVAIGTGVQGGHRLLFGGPKQSTVQRDLWRSGICNTTQHQPIFVILGTVGRHLFGGWAVGNVSQLGGGAALGAVLLVASGCFYTTGCSLFGRDHTGRTSQHG